MYTVRPMGAGGPGPRVAPDPNSRALRYSEMLSLSAIINREPTFHGLVDHRHDPETAKTCGGVEPRRTMTAGIRGTRN